MTDTRQDKVRKLFESRAKAETELQRLLEKVQDAVENKDRRIRVERLVTFCDEAMTKLFAKHEQLFELAGKTEDPSLVKQDLETWLNEVTTRNDEISKKARDYIDQCPPVDGASQSSTTVTKRKQPSKTSASRTSRQSRTCSQRHRDLLIAKQRKEEIERQNEAALRFAKQQQELELERLQEEQELLRLRTDRLKKEQALRVEQLEEENRKKLAEATLTELELTEDLSDSQSEFLDTVSQLAASTTTLQGTNAPSVTASASAPLATAMSIPISTVTVPTSHVLPNLSAWTFPTGPSNPPVIVNPVTSSATVFPTVLPATSVASTSSPVIPVTAGGTVYYINQTSLATVPAPSSAPVPTTFPAVPSTATPLATPPSVNVPQPATTSFTVQDLA